MRSDIIIFDDVERDDVLFHLPQWSVQWCTVVYTGVQSGSVLSQMIPQFSSSLPTRQSGLTALLTVGVLRSIEQVRTF